MGLSYLQHNFMNTKTFLTAFFAVLALSACGPEEDNPTPAVPPGSIPATSVKITPASIELVVDSTATVEVTVVPANTTDVTWIWKSDHPEVAVAEKSTVTATGTGDAVLTLTVGSVTADLKVKVTAPANPAPGTDPGTQPDTLIAKGAVDLGLSVKWGAYNVGAKSPEEFGGYYSYGETEACTDARTYANYKWYSSSKGLLKYNLNPENGIVDDREYLLPEDDVATVTFGDGWRMPTEDEMRDLVMKCSWSNYEYNGVQGYKVTGTTGNSIFIPKAGLVEVRQTEATHVGESVWFWTCQNNSRNGLTHAYAYNSGEDYLDFLVKHLVYNRICGMSVRPVYGEAIKRDPITLNSWSGISQSAVSLGLRAYLHIDEDRIPDAQYGICYSKTSQNPTLADASVSGTLQSGTNNVLATLTGLEPDTRYWCRAWVSVGGQTYYSGAWDYTTSKASTMLATGDLISSKGTSARVSASFNLTDAAYKDVEMGVCYGTSANPAADASFVHVTGSGAESGPATYKATLDGLTSGREYHWRAALKIDGQVLYGEDKIFTAGTGGVSLEAVDLGLSVSWANMNVEAETLTEKGSLFSWGETQAKTVFSLKTYKWYDYEAGKYTKYTTKTDNASKVDNKLVLDPEDDAAYAATSGEFRMPLISELSELVDTSNTVMVGETLDGVLGVRVTGRKTGNSVFIPCAGYQTSEHVFGDERIILLGADRSKGHVNGVCRFLIIENVYEGRTPTSRFEALSSFYGYRVRGVK